MKTQNKSYFFYFNTLPWQLIGHSNVTTNLHAEQAVLINAILTCASTFVTVCIREMVIPMVILLSSHATKRSQGKLATKYALAAALGPLACSSRSARSPSLPSRSARPPFGSLTYPKEGILWFCWLFLFTGFFVAWLLSRFHIPISALYAYKQDGGGGIFFKKGSSF